MEQVYDNDNHLSPDNDNDSPLPPLGPIEQTDEDLCRTMWVAVIFQAVIDAGGKNCNHLEQAKAREWLEGRGDILSDFAAVCDLAGVDFEKTRARCAYLVQSKDEPLDFRCMKKPPLRNRMKEDPRRYYQRVARNARLRNERRERIRLWDTPHKQSGDNGSRPAVANENSNNQPTERNDEQQAN